MKKLKQGTYKKGNVLRYNVGSRLQYYKELRTFVDRMTSTVNREVLALFKKPFAREFFAMDDSISSQSRILLNTLTSKFNALFKSKAREIAERMVYGQEKLSNASVKNSASTVYEGLSLPGNIVSPDLEDVIKASVEENVSLISSISQEYMKSITGDVMRAVTEGSGEKSLRASLKRYEGITQRRAKRIAADQVNKVYTAVNIQKLKSLDQSKFVWVHSGGGQHPRDSHLKIDGEIFSLDHSELIAAQQSLGFKYQDQGFPGYPVNCRCTMQMVVELT